MTNRFFPFHIHPIFMPALLSILGAMFFLADKSLADANTTIEMKMIKIIGVGTHPPVRVNVPPLNVDDTKSGPRDIKTWAPVKVSPIKITGTDSGSVIEMKTIKVIGVGAATPVNVAPLSVTGTD